VESSGYSTGVQSPGAAAPSSTRHQPLATRYGGFAAFTLIELLVVVAIIAILAGITLAAMGGVNRKTTRDRTKTEIAVIANALESYRSENGQYPPSGPSNTIPRAAIEGYLQTDKIQPSDNGYLDPFGKQYIYIFPAQRNRFGYDLYSTAGEDPSATHKHIGNW
jgi:general secretion pathway protein G